MTEVTPRSRTRPQNLQRVAPDQVQPRPRSRPTAKPKKAERPKTSVVGGPRGLHPAFVRGYGVLHFSEGQTSRQWPYRIGSDLIGLYLHEFRDKKGRAWHASSETSYVCAHVWRYDRGADSFIYIGKTATADAAKIKLETLRDQDDAPAQPPVVQPRQRRRPV